MSRRPIHHRCLEVVDVVTFDLAAGADAHVISKIGFRACGASLRRGVCSDCGAVRPSKRHPGSRSLLKAEANRPFSLGDLLAYIEATKIQVPPEALGLV